MRKVPIEELPGSSKTFSGTGLTQESIVDSAAWMGAALHDLAQPLTALECVLFLSTLEPEAEVQQLRQVIEDALTQCNRMAAGVRAMQDRLHGGR